MNWLEVTAASVPEKLDELCEQLEAAGVSGLVINDEASVTDFLEKNKKYWDYVDDEVFDKVRGICTVQFYLEDSPAGYEELKRIQQEVPGSYSAAVVKDEDWENNWKQYYHPIETGERLVIVPEWLEVPDSGRIPLRMDPGLIFGTGSHPTTRMCLEELENLQPRQVLDLGCGSGILGIASLLLGADRAVGVDIDDKAPKVVLENAALNGIYEDRLAVIAGDILSDKQVQQRLAGSYDLVLANIVADVIIALAPRVLDYLGEGGHFVCSGIMEGRQYEVEQALHQAGLAIIRHRKQEDWHCYIAVRKEEKI